MECRAKPITCTIPDRKLHYVILTVLRNVSVSRGLKDFKDKEASLSQGRYPIPRGASPSQDGGFSIPNQWGQRTTPGLAQLSNEKELDGIAVVMNKAFQLWASEEIPFELKKQAFQQFYSSSLSLPKLIFFPENCRCRFSLPCPPAVFKMKICPTAGQPSCGSLESKLQILVVKILIAYIHTHHQCH